MEEALRALLLETAALAALVDRRIDWGLRPQGDPLPGVSLFVVGGVVGMHLSGADGWTRSRVQIDCWGRTYKAARDAADTLAAPPAGRLIGFRGVVSGRRLRTFVITRRAGTDIDAAGVVHRTSLDVTVWDASA